MRTISLLALAGCVATGTSPQLRKLATYERFNAPQSVLDSEQQEREGVRWPLTLPALALTPEAASPLIPFGSWTDTYSMDEQAQARLARRLGAEHGADVATVHSGVSQFERGGVAFHYAFGVSPVFGSGYVKPVTITFFAVAKATLGIGLGPAGVLLHVEQGGPAWNAGARHGDILRSVGGRPVVAEDLIRSSHWLAVAELEPGSRTRLQWIRPGVGLLDGEAVAAPVDEAAALAAVAQLQPAPNPGAAR